MKKQHCLEFIVGCFMVLGLVGFLFLAVKVSGLSHLFRNHSYQITANFDNIGDLKVRAPVTIAGVRVGEVVKIILQPDTFNAQVTMKIDKQQSKIPVLDTHARILTQGLLGSNYINIVPGFEDKRLGFLVQGGVIEKTESAIILENLIGKLLFNLEKNNEN